MPRAFYTVTATDIPGLRMQLNTIMAELMLQLQRIEGFDGATPEFRNHVNMKSQKLQNVGAGSVGTDGARRSDIETFDGSISIAGTITVTGEATFNDDIDIDNIRLDGNTISITNTNGGLTLQANGTGKIAITPKLSVDNIDLDGNTISTTNANGDLNLEPNGTGDVVTTKTLKHSGSTLGFFGKTPASQASHILNATASHTITDPADTPATADALRDDLVANALPEITSALDALGSKINSVILVLERHGLKANS